MTARIDRTGETNQNNKNELMEIIEYHKYNDILVEFIDTGTIVKSGYQQFCNGQIKDPMTKNIFGVACIGIGKYKSSINKKMTLHYESWHGIIRRLFDPKINTTPKNKSYINVSICDEWLNYQLFAKWFDDNYYEIPNEKMTIDKDILNDDKINKIYSSEFCCFVPERINTGLSKGINDTQRKYPHGVSFHPMSGQYAAQISTYGKNKHIGLFNTPEEAFGIYKIEKEQYIKDIANKYKEYLPENVYIKLINYQIEITD